MLAALTRLKVRNVHITKPLFVSPSLGERARTICLHLSSAFRLGDKMVLA